MSTQQTINQTIHNEYEAAAADYQRQPGHDISLEERACWAADLSAELLDADGKSALDIGAGTGVFSRFLAEHGLAVMGLEPSAGMLAEAQRQSMDTQYEIDYHLGGDEQLAEFPDSAFDLIAARQSVCYFTDPVATFRQCRRLLRPGGQLMVIEGIWGRKGWGESALIDQLPLSCLSTRRTVDYCLELAGFEVVRNDWLVAVNGFHRQSDGADGSRYVVIAQPAGSSG